MSLETFTIVAHREARHREVWSAVKPRRGGAGAGARYERGVGAECAKTRTIWVGGDRTYRLEEWREGQSPEEHTASSEVARACPLLTLPRGDFSSRSCQVSLSVGPSTQRSPLRTLLPTAAAAA